MHSMLRKFVLLLATALASAGSATARAVGIASIVTTGNLAMAAPLINGNFETGDLSGWHVWNFGFTQAVDATAGAAPIEGNYSALLVTRDPYQISCPGDAPNGPDIWATSCPTPIPFVSAPSDPAPALPYSQPAGLGFIHVGLFQQVALQAGDVVSLAVRDYYSTEPAGADTVQFTLATGPIPEDPFLSTVMYSCWPLYEPLGEWCGGNIISDDPSWYQYIGSPVDGRWEVEVPFDGLWTVSVGVTSVDFLFSAGFLIDDIRVSPYVVPEPSALALLGLALAGLAFSRRRKLHRVAPIQA